MTDGSLYKGDPCLPVFSWNETPYSWKDIVIIFSKSYDKEELCTSPPINIAHNVTFLVSNKDIKNIKDIVCDDMGAWKHNGSPLKYFTFDAVDNGINISTKEETSYVLKRSYYINSSSPDLRKIVSTVKDPSGTSLPYTLIQYIFNKEEHPVINVNSHGNSKGRNSRPYRRTLPSIVLKMKNSVTSNKPPKQILEQIYAESGDVIKARSLGELPRGRRDIYNARQLAKREGSIAVSDGSNKSLLCADDVWLLLEKAKTEEEHSPEKKFIRDFYVHPHFSAVLALDRQLDELVLFCTNPKEFAVFNIDPTFNIFFDNISLTVTTYRNLKLESVSTGKNPVFIGPLLMHQKKDWKTYSRFANSIITERPELGAIIACGTDGERALVDGFRRNLPYSIFLRCFIHFKKNIESQLKVMHFSKEDIKSFVVEIFGKQSNGVKHFGLVDSNSEEEFDEKLRNLKNVWDSREKKGSSCQSFYDWFLTEKGEDIKTYLLKPVRVNAGLGDPPSEFSTNDVEAGNFILKHGLNFDKQKPREFIDKIREIIEIQFHDEERAVYGMGQYQLSSKFMEKYSVKEFEWGRLNAKQRLKKIDVFLKATIDEAGDNDKPDSLTHHENVTSDNISMTPEECQIETVPITVLKSFFKKAAVLLKDSSLVVEKPGSTDGSFVVAAACNNVFFVKPGPSGSYKCDKNCPNVSTKICEHVIAVAEKKGKLFELVQWYKKSKSGPSLTGLALSGGPKSAGKKSGSRKRSNKRKAEANEFVDFLGQYQTNNALPSPNTNQPNVLNCPASPQLPQIHYQNQSSVFNMNNIVLPSRLLNRPVHIKSPLASNFYLKWVFGTTVSKCYGCDEKIVNPPMNNLENLIIARHDNRLFRDSKTGQWRYSSDLQNNHFHISQRCVFLIYPDYQPSQVDLSNTVIPQLQMEHRMKLLHELNIVVNNPLGAF